MTPLRQQMLDAMTLRGLAQRTQECYVQAIARMALHYGRSPQVLNVQEVQAYLLHLVRQHKLSYSSLNQVACASRFLFATVLGRTDEAARVPMARAPQKQPQLLARQEIARLLDSCQHPQHRTVLQTLYTRAACGSPRPARCA